ncbi:excalibur calcium-binding domain-containing protein [Streptosporangium sp. NPDC023963]|uniref:excalibur calcium-binding domain-containing protein n=1 Tax=Streptosporangium sp. NPDC023963 TaxID=3155608 RepID=UPI003421228B
MTMGMHAGQGGPPVPQGPPAGPDDPSDEPWSSSGSYDAFTPPGRPGASPGRHARGEGKSGDDLPAGAGGPAGFDEPGHGDRGFGGPVPGSGGSSFDAFAGTGPGPGPGGSSFDAFGGAGSGPGGSDLHAFGGPGPGGSDFDAFGGPGLGAGPGGSDFDAFGGPGAGSGRSDLDAFGGTGSGRSDFDAFGARSSGSDAFGAGGAGLGDPGSDPLGPGGARAGDPAFGGTALGGQGAGGPVGPVGPVPGGPGGPDADTLALAEGQAPTGQGPGGPVADGPGAGVPGGGERRAGESPDGAPGGPRASRVTTAILVTVLVFVVLITGVLGTVAVLMTRNPDMPLGGTPPRRLATPLHFAPVTEAKIGPCTIPETYPDDLGQTCYSVAAGVNVNAVRKIEAIQEKSGAYSVRIAFAPAFREQINDLTTEAVNEDDPVRQQIAIVVGQKVVAAPRVAQAITDDSLSIAGSFTKEQADAMVVRLLGSGAVVPQPTDGTQPSASVFTPSDGPAASPPADQQPVSPPASQPANPPANQPVTPPASQPVTPPATGPATTNTAGADANRPADTTGDTSQNASGEGVDRKFSSCKAATENGYGPYTRGVHEEYQWYIDGDNDGVVCEQEGAG